MTENTSEEKTNKISKYLFYALGEIILVVIGIINALQLINWNQNRVELGNEQLILKSLRTNLEDNLLDLHETKERTLLAHGACVKMLTLIHPEGRNYSNQ